ncbi:alpha/beta fold hydrolase [Brevundimonas vesicularis]|uniref:alpha/beta fold hydrolase n=1 Tax=Brevundimonas vesicularis TaxID=41276 RepID=UPI0038D3A148
MIRSSDRIFSILMALILALGFLAGSGAWTPSAAQTASRAVPGDFVSERIHVEVRGEGPDVILIPGLASTAAIWDRTARALEGRYRLHLITVKGFGDLAPAANASGLISAPVATEVARYIREKGLGRPALIGHSMGGQIALRVAAEIPDQISRVMAVDSSPFFPSLISAGATSADVEPLARLVYQGLILFGDDALRTQARSAGLELGGASDSLFNSLGWQGGDRRTLAQGLYEVMTSDLRARLPDITVPVTVVYGWSNDSRSPRAQVDDLFRLGYRNLPRPATFERIEGAEHMVMIDQPRRFQAAVERFLR